MILGGWGPRDCLAYEAARCLDSEVFRQVAVNSQALTGGLGRLGLQITGSRRVKAARRITSLAERQDA